MKVEFEKNITVMKTLSYILIASTKIYSDYSKELGINIPTKVFIIFTIFPLIYIFIYPLFKIVKRKTKKHETYFKFLNDLNIMNFVLLGLFMCVLITQEFWNNLGLLNLLMFVALGVLLSSALVVFFSLIITWFYVKFID
jgi:hypothetical protein